MAAKDQAVSTNCFKNEFFKEEINSKCRLCKLREKTVDHLNSGCPILAKKGYLMGLDNVCAYLHYSMCKALDIGTTEK